jgi:hypothetical protein
MNRMRGDGVWQEITRGYSKPLCMQKAERAEKKLKISLNGIKCHAVQ